MLVVLLVSKRCPRRWPPGTISDFDVGGLLGECAVAIPEQDRNGAVVLVDHGEIEIAVVLGIEVARGDCYRTIPDWVGGLAVECAVAITEENGYGVVALVDYREVEIVVRIFVEGAQRHAARSWSQP